MFYGEKNFFLIFFKSYKIGVYTNVVMCSRWWIRFCRPITYRFFLILPEVSDPWCWPKGSQPLGTRLLRAFRNEPSTQLIIWGPREADKFYIWYWPGERFSGILGATVRACSGLSNAMTGDNISANKIPSCHTVPWHPSYFPVLKYSGGV